ncbi:related to ATG9 - integral membrane protein required for Cvt and autophagy transport [Melanopsichium pennsylvanicum]|uniref:Autophagy-related protein 9 n=2 Tax=Melanopsichium pennsylvanicum TaxID=63383 RepID=A0AAJ4XLI9_9BASI|nr:related to ATG9-integral membrane protein required for Cvt and autophagy transport [Melanopsichium pennsylvanicum 4]SNX83966.1 related to ATG9 - integral membrane protein required for Cvt and autophagy transport [Melanopsichium pennsylvanicum]
MDSDSPFADPDRPESHPPQPQPGGSATISNSLKAAIFDKSRIVHPSISNYTSSSRPHHEDTYEESYPDSIDAGASSSQVPIGSSQHASQTYGNITNGHHANVDQHDQNEQDAEDLFSDEEIGLMAAESRRYTSSLPPLPEAASRSSNRSRRRRTNASNPRSRATAVGGLNAKQRALWMWANVINLDAFLEEVYGYYVGRGAICIALSRSLNLLTVAFVISFSTFLFGCIDYSAIKHDGQLGDVIVGHCVAGSSPFTTVLVLILAAAFGWQVVQFVLGLSRLRAMHRFYEHLLGIPDADVQSIPWNEVVNRLSALREQHPNTSLSSADEIELGDRASSSLGPSQQQRLDAHDVANRIMRQENYLIALFNENILDLSVPGLRNRSPALTRSLEWNLNFCLLGFLFNSNGQVRHQFLSERYRADLIEGLRRRFLFMAVVNAIFAPFIVLYLLAYSFFRYFEEYHQDPSNLGSRQYTQYARWKFREFNELPHLFRRRCHTSYAPAQKYIDQFPKEKTAIVARFVAFVAGSFTAVLILASVIDPDLFLHFDITPQRNVLFYIGVFGAILAVSRGMIPDEHLVFEPEAMLREVIQHTHYLPQDWKGRFHSAEVHQAFGQLYTLKIYIFFQELLSVVTTPFVLWLSLPGCSPDLIDFFRKYTIHVDGLGHVCSFAVFDFARQPTASTMGGAAARGIHHQGTGKNKHGRTTERKMRNGMREGKMEQSILGFKASHPDWDPVQASNASMHQGGDAERDGSASVSQEHGNGKLNADATSNTSGGAKVKDLLDHIYRGRGAGGGGGRW